MVLVSRSEEIERVLVTDASNYRKSRILTVMGRPVLGDALDALDGTRWMRRRRIAAPAFHGRRADAEAAAVVEATEHMLATWRDGDVRRFDSEALGMMTAAACRSLEPPLPPGKAAAQQRMRGQAWSHPCNPHLY